MADEKVARKLAAKLATDMASYSRFVDAEEKEMMGSGKCTGPKHAPAQFYKEQPAAFHLPRVLEVA